MVWGEHQEGGDTRNRGDKGRCQSGWSDPGGRSSRSNEDRSKDRPAANPVDTSYASDRSSDDGEQGGWKRPLPLSVWPLPDEEPDSERYEDAGDRDVEAGLPRQELHSEDRAHDDSWQCAEDQEPGQPSASLPLPPVAVQRPGGRHHVVEQLRWGERRARSSQQPTWNGKSRTAPDTPAGLATVATTNDAARAAM